MLLFAAHILLFSMNFKFLIMTKKGNQKNTRTKALYSKLLSSKKKKLREERVQRSLSLTDLIQRIQEMRKKKMKGGDNSLLSLQ